MSSIARFIKRQKVPRELAAPQVLSSYRIPSVAAFLHLPPSPARLFSWTLWIVKAVLGKRRPRHDGGVNDGPSLRSRGSAMYCGKAGGIVGLRCPNGRQEGAGCTSAAPCTGQLTPPWLS